MCVRGLFLYALYGFREVGAKHVRVVVEKCVNGTVAHEFLDRARVGALPQ